MIKTYRLEFQGYTWDQYFHVIADKKGLLVIYSGNLDREGNASMNEILDIRWEKKFGNIYDDLDCFRAQLRQGHMLFFSYSEIGQEVGKEVIKYIDYLKNNPNVPEVNRLDLHCEGACALFPDLMKGA